MLHIPNYSLGLAVLACHRGEAIEKQKKKTATKTFEKMNHILLVYVYDLWLYSCTRVSVYPCTHVLMAIHTNENKQICTNQTSASLLYIWTVRRASKIIIKILTMPRTHPVVSLTFRMYVSVSINFCIYVRRHHTHTRMSIGTNILILYSFIFKKICYQFKCYIDQILRTLCACANNTKYV